MTANAAPKTRESIVVAICLLFGVAAAPAQSAFHPRFSRVIPGLDYAHVVITNQPWSIHIARLQRSRSDLELITTLGNGTIQGLSSLSDQVRHVPADLGKPVVAVNGDFFLIRPGPYQGDPEGLQIINGELVSTPGLLSFWVEGRQLHLEKVLSALGITWPSGRENPLSLNQTPRADGAVLFTPIFGPSTRATNMVEVVLERAGTNAWLPLRAGKTYRARVRSINPSGDTPLAPDIAVLAVGSDLTNHLPAVELGDVLQISTTLSKDLSKATAAIGGGPLLVHAAKEQQWSPQKGPGTYLLPRHPRTALGFNSHYLFLVEVDGRQKELSVGMTVAELASFMKNLGCNEAMNLDGGGSSTFWLNGKVMNSPSDKHERGLANALVIVQRDKPHR
ncbi:MAG: hypothetical protein QOJ40_1604 [Verrucomicrobiota bacterium]